jgi:chaperone modulatory protein CbpM
MNIDTADALSLDENSEVSFSQLLVLSGLSDNDLRELVDHGALTPINPEASSWTFTSYCVVVARRASRLSRDFELDAHAVSVLLGFVERIEALESELHALRAGALGRGTATAKDPVSR